MKLAKTVMFATAILASTMSGQAMAQQQQTFCDSYIDTVYDYCEPIWEESAYASLLDCTAINYSTTCPERWTPTSLPDRAWVWYKGPVCFYTGQGMGNGLFGGCPG